MKHTLVAIAMLTLFVNVLCGAELSFVRKSGKVPLSATISHEEPGAAEVKLTSIDSQGNVLLTSRTPHLKGMSEVSIGKMKVGETLIYRTSEAYPAVRVKVLEVNLEKGHADLEISTFWPEPNK